MRIAPVQLLDSVHIYRQLSQNSRITLQMAVRAWRADLSDCIILGFLGRFDFCGAVGVEERGGEVGVELFELRVAP